MIKRQLKDQPGSSFEHPNSDNLLGSRAVVAVVLASSKTESEGAPATTAVGSTTSCCFAASRAGKRPFE